MAFDRHRRAHAVVVRAVLGGDVHRLHGGHHAHDRGQRAGHHERVAAAHGAARALHARPPGASTHLVGHHRGWGGHCLDVRAQRERRPEATAGHDGGAGRAHCRRGQLEHDAKERGQG